MSEALLWQVTKKYSSKMIVRHYPKRSFTIEKGSLNHTRKLSDSGICRKKAVDITTDEDDIPVISLKNDKPQFARNPDKMWRSTTLSGGVRKALAKTDALLSVYAPSMKKPAMKKVSALYKALARKNKMKVDALNN